MTDLDSLERIEGAATPGPWEQTDNESIVGENFVVLERDGDIAGCDRRLIVAARNALPGLIAELRRLRELEAAAIERDDVALDDAGLGMYTEYARVAARYNAAIAACRVARGGG